MAPQAPPPSFALFALSLPSDENLHLTLHAGSVAQVRRQRARKNNTASSSDDSTLAPMSVPARRNSTGSVSSAFSWQESVFHVRRVPGAAWGQGRVSEPLKDVQGGKMVGRGHPNPLKSNPVV